MKLDQRGAVLVFILVVFVVLTILGVAILQASLSENKQAVYQESNVQDYYVARSGAEAMASYLIENPDGVEDVINRTAGSTEYASAEINGQEFRVKVTGEPSALTGKITMPIIESRAYRGGDEVGMVKLQLLETNLLLGAIFSDLMPKIGQNNLVTGDVGTNASTIDFGSEDIVGNITLGPGATESYMTSVEDNVTAPHTVDKLTKEIILQQPDTSKFVWDWPDWPEFTDTDGKTKTRIDSNGMGYYRTDNFVGGSYRLYGDGEIHLLVNAAGTIDLNGVQDYISRASGDVRMYIYYSGTSVVNINGQNTNDFCLYAPNATVKINGGNGTLTGAVICKEFVGPNSGNAYMVHDPELDMNHLVIDGVVGYMRGVYVK